MAHHGPIPTDRPSAGDRAARAAGFIPPGPRPTGPLGRVLVWISSVLVAIPWICLAWGSLVDLPPWPVIVVLTLLPFVVVSVAAWLFLLWTVLPDAKLLPLLLVASLGPGLIRWGPIWAASPDPLSDGGVSLKVMSWNVQRLWQTTEDIDAATCVVDAVTQEAPDVLLLMEVTTADLKVLATGADLTCTHTTYRTRNMPNASGMAVCTRGDVWSLGPSRAATYTPGDDWQYQQTELTSKTAEATFFSVHLAPHRLLHDPVGSWESVRDRAPATSALQFKQAASLLKAASETSQPIIAGDFNSSRDVPLHQLLRATFTDTWEHAAHGLGSTVDVLGILPLRIDFTYVSPALQVLGADIPDVACSDHRPVISTLGVPPRTVETQNMTDGRSIMDHP